MKNLKTENKCICETAETPCSHSCTCANEIMSGGCMNCAKYGSKEQRDRARIRLKQTN